MLHKDTMLTKSLKAFFILLPLFLSTAWLISVTRNRVTVIATDSGLKLSPSHHITPIVIGLILFKAGYLLFIYLMFKEEVIDFYKACQKKVHIKINK